MSVPIGAFPGDYARLQKKNRPPNRMKSQTPGSDGSSITVKKSRFHFGRQPSDTTISSHSASTAAAATSPTPTERPATATARSRGLSRNASISSLNDARRPFSRRRSTSFRKPSDMLAQTTSRDTGTRPSTATTNDFQATNASSIQRIQSAGSVHRVRDTAAKRISILEYLKKAHEGNGFWLSTLGFARKKLNTLPYFDKVKLARRATNYFILGNSIPAVLDPNANNLMEYLKAFNTLLTEFEGYTSQHPPDGSSLSAMSRMRKNRMFSRPSGTGLGKARRGSGIESSGLPTTSEDGHMPSATYTPVQGGDRDLSTGESYNYLLTPMLPFDPDYYETFATLCDVLVDTYRTILGLVQPIDTPAPTVEDLFLKADLKIKKLLVHNIGRELETASKVGLRTELGGAGKAVLGGLVS